MAKKAKTRRVREVRANRATDTLPALSTLTELPAFGDIAPSERQCDAYAAACERAVEAGAAADELALGCVVRLDRGYPAIVCADATFRAEFATRLTKGEFSRAAVGDWVCARRPGGHEMGLIEEILPRESDIARWKGGARGERQTLAANVDLVIVVQQLGEQEVDYARIARSAVIVRDCGARLAVVLSKADRAGAAGVARDIDALHEVLGADVSLVVTSAGAAGDADLAALAEAAARRDVPFGEEGVRALVPAGVVAIVLGESGAGKSTLLNALLGRAVLETGAVRASDDAGRHTTVTRRMVKLEGAGVIVDEPGLRSLPLVGHERGLAKVFPDIAAEAQACRFRDCTHTHEPGCAVLEHAQDEGYAGRRLDAYLALAREMRASRQTLDPDVVI
ncbi:MAG: GTPase RsgA [Atopobiaceae bacterium]|nr:GTPase RsgA [Atopobiaceae bacterium]